MVVSYFIVHILNLEIMEIKKIKLTSSCIEEIKKVAASKINIRDKFNFLNTKYRFNVDVVGKLPTNEQLLNFSINIDEKEYTKQELHQILYHTSTSDVLKETCNQKTRTVTNLKVGDIVYIEGLRHLFLILNTYKSGFFKGVSLSSSPDLVDSFPIKSRFLDKTSYARLTVSINETEKFKTKWVASVSQSQVKLVKLWLQQNKL